MRLCTITACQNADPCRCYARYPPTLQRSITAGNFVAWQIGATARPSSANDAVTMPTPYRCERRLSSIASTPASSFKRAGRQRLSSPKASPH